MPIDQKKVLKRMKIMREAMAEGKKKSAIPMPVRDVMTGRAAIEGVKVVGRGIKTVAQRMIQPPLQPIQKKQMELLRKKKMPNKMPMKKYLGE